MWDDIGCIFRVVGILNHVGMCEQHQHDQIGLCEGRLLFLFRYRRYRCYSTYLIFSDIGGIEGIVPTYSFSDIGGIDGSLFRVEVSRVL